MRSMDALSKFLSDLMAGLGLSTLLVASTKEPSLGNGSKNPVVPKTLVLVPTELSGSLAAVVRVVAMVSIDTAETPTTGLRFLVGLLESQHSTNSLLLSSIAMATTSFLRPIHESLLIKQYLLFLISELKASFNFLIS